VNYIIHEAIGLLGMVAGLVGGKFCSHLRHQIIVGVALVTFETILTVNAVG
jgi:hypothetical protein